ncbi:MAG TPA: hypothetical protein ACFYDZ_03680 [Candidatus Brocadiaceae bacterium]
MQKTTPLFGLTPLCPPLAGVRGVDRTSPIVSAIRLARLYALRGNPDLDAERPPLAFQRRALEREEHFIFWLAPGE